MRALLLLLIVVSVVSAVHAQNVPPRIVVSNGTPIALDPCDPTLPDYDPDDCPLLEKEVQQGCNENWKCTEWSGCVDGIRSRECVDANFCVTSLAQPATSEPCGVEVAEEKGGIGITPVLLTFAFIAIIIAIIIFFVRRRRVMPGF
ncbi:hypothetical protein HYX10_01210 [Candidatus Woesearchaeota archaeon]|nr:hypothetical protein [Candidatus Woesearchaeota archaeon]